MSWIHNNLLLPLCEPERHKGLGRRLRAIEAVDRLPAHEWAARQASSVRALLDHAYANVPYYRRIFDDTNMRPADWKPGTPIPLPLLTRDLLRANGEDLRSRAFARESLRTARSGGTSSTPVAMWRDLEGLRNRTALQFYFNRAAGYDQGTSSMHIWGAVRDLELHPSWRWRLYEQGLLRRTMCSGAELSPAIMDGFLQQLNRRKPKILYGYSGTTARFAEYLLQVRVPYHRPSQLIVTAEPLSLRDRETLEHAFGCPVTEHYGSRDVGIIAAQCEAGRFHFHPWGSMIELLPIAQAENGTLSRLIVTDLTNSGMPLIRYDTGDCVVHDDSRCPCGLAYPSVLGIHGRAHDNFVLPDGSLVTGITLSTRLGTLTFRAVQQVQLIQKSVDHVHLRYSAQGDPSVIDADLAGLRAEMDRALGRPMRWSADRLPEVPRERSGKFRITISEVHDQPSRIA